VLDVLASNGRGEVTAAVAQTQPNSPLAERRRWHRGKMSTFKTFFPIAPYGSPIGRAAKLINGRLNPARPGA